MHLIRVGPRIFKFPGVEFYAVGDGTGWELMELRDGAAILWTPWPMRTRRKVVEFFKALRSLEITSQKEQKP